MKRIISLILAVVCVMSLCLSGCTKQEIEPVTVGELLDLLENEGYTNIQHEEGTCDYFLIDSGDSLNEDENDIHISLNTIYTNNSDNIVSCVTIDYNLFNDEVEHLLRTISYKLSNDNKFAEDIVFTSETETFKTIEKGGLWFGIFDFSGEYIEKHPETKYYTIYLSVDVDE